MVTGVESQKDLSVPDTDVVQALNALPDFLADLPPCAYMYMGAGTADFAVGIDLSGSAAALEVEVPTAADVNAIDPYTGTRCLSATFEGVPVNQEVMPAKFGDTGDFAAIGD